MKIEKAITAIQRLSATKRFSQVHLSKSENVLEHSGFVTLLSYLVGISLQGEGFKIDTGTLLSKSIIHDFEEIITGDLPRPFKYQSKILREQIKIAESQAIVKLIDDIELDINFYETWETAKVGAEGSIIKLVDILSARQKIYEEIFIRGNKSLYEICESSEAFTEAQEKTITRCQEYFPESKTISDINNYLTKITERICTS